MTSECRAGPRFGAGAVGPGAPLGPGPAAAPSHAAPALRGKEGSRRCTAREPGISETERKAGNVGWDFLKNANSCGAARRLPPAVEKRRGEVPL